jgi:hypothetical protein
MEYRMANRKGFGNRDLGLIKAVSHHLLGGTEESHEKPQDSQDWACGLMGKRGGLDDGEKRKMPAPTEIRTTIPRSSNP